METQNLKYSKFIYLAVALVMTLGVFLYTGTDVHADDVISNNTQVQITLTDAHAAYLFLQRPQAV